MSPVTFASANFQLHRNTGRDFILFIFLCVESKIEELILTNNNKKNIFIKYFWASSKKTLSLSLFLSLAISFALVKRFGEIIMKK